MKRIKISSELRDYIEMLHYEAFRYKDLLLTVNRDCCEMTDEEWESSLDYFETLSIEAQYSLQVAKNTIAEMYAEEINNQCWHINFDDCVLVIGCTQSESETIRSEQYSDFLRRLYPKNIKEQIKINGTGAKDITLQVTEACNMACTYCYQHHKTSNNMSFDTAKRFINMILDADEKTNSYITSTLCDGAIINFIGGEPWLEIDLISKVSDHFIGELFRRKHPWAIKFCFSVCSNGLLHFEPNVQEYIKRHKSHFNYNISIDGDKELHDTCRIDLWGNGTYDRAIAAVQDYQKNIKGKIGSKMTISPNNVNKIFNSLVHMIQDNDYTDINLNCVYEEGWTAEHAKILYQQLISLSDWLYENNLIDKIRLSIFDRANGTPLSPESNNNWCGGVGFMLAINHKGDMYPCLRYMETSSNNNFPSYTIGDLESGINCKKEHKERIECLSCITRRSQSTDKCFNCPIATGCGWCSAHNYETFGTPNKRTTFICIMHKARSLANVYYWRLRGKEFPLCCPKEWAVEIIGEKEYNKLNNMEANKSGKYNSR